MIYLFVLQVALAASLLCSLGTPSHTLELKINSFYLGRGSDGFLIWRKYRNNGRAGSQEAGGEASPGCAPESPRRGPWPSPKPQASPSETGPAKCGHGPAGTPALGPGPVSHPPWTPSCSWLWEFLEQKEPCFSSSDNLVPVSNSIPGALSSSLKLCLSFLICHRRTGVLPGVPQVVALGLGEAQT